MAKAVPTATTAFDVIPTTAVVDFATGEVQPGLLDRVAEWLVVGPAVDNLAAVAAVH